MSEATPARRDFSKVDFRISVPSTETAVGCPGGLAAFINLTPIWNPIPGWKLSKYGEKSGLPAEGVERL
jgi:hypothetical protein